MLPPQPSRQFARKLPEAGFLPKEERDGVEGDRVMKVLGKIGRDGRIRPCSFER
jgi:hypothetical protein